MFSNNNSKRTFDDVLSAKTEPERSAATSATRNCSDVDRVLNGAKLRGRLARVRNLVDLESAGAFLSRVDPQNVDWDFANKNSKIAGDGVLLLWLTACKRCKGELSSVPSIDRHRLGTWLRHVPITPRRNL